MSKAVDRRLRRMEKHVLLPKTPLEALMPEERAHLHAYLEACSFDDPQPPPSDAHLTRMSKKRIKDALDWWMEQTIKEFDELKRRGELPPLRYFNLPE